MARKEAPMRCCMIVQQFDHRYFLGWTPEELQALDAAAAGNIAPLVTVIHTRLFNAGFYAVEVHGIVHDKDVQRKWDSTALAYVEAPKTPHFHVLVKFGTLDGTKPAYVNDVAQAVGVEPQAIEKAPRGRNAYSNMAAYLIHIKYPNKYQYSPDAVYSTGLDRQDGVRLWKPYLEMYAEEREAWMRGRAVVQSKAAEESIEDLEEKILTGQVTKEEIVLTDELYAVYSRYCRRCEDAFRVYGERRAYKTLQALQNGEFRLGVFYILGEPGAGKTTLAKQFVGELIRRSPEWTGEAWRVCKTAASNPMDEYNGEEILFMDDVRGSALSASDWLKLLDPYNASPASARYHNKTPACRAIVITSTKEPIEFFYYCKQLGGGNRSEAMDQFMRRIQSLTRVIKADEFETRAQIAECEKSNRYLTWVQSDTGSPQPVELTYRFDYGEPYSMDEAVQKMVNMVEANNKISSLERPAGGNQEDTEQQ